jgi:prepilin-type N-terminal cleavage/methylation domain-containing protein
MRPKLYRSRNRGLTIIELVVVVAVLAILAGFIVPRLGFVRNLAAESGNATIIADAASQAVFYNTAVGHYPQGEDSLLDTANAVYANLNSSLKGALTSLDLSTDNLAGKSLAAQLDPNGASFVLYEGTAGGSPTSTPNTDFTNLETITYSSGAGAVGHVAQVTPPVAADVTANHVNYQIYKAAYGLSNLSATTGAPLDGTYLIAVGYGANSQINGKTGLEAPLLFDKTPGEYTRPVLLLKVFGSTSAAVGVPQGTSATTSISIGFDASTANAQLAKYAVDQNR